METFGRYIAVRELHHIGFSSLWSARPSEDADAPDSFAVKSLLISEPEVLSPPGGKGGGAVITQSPETVSFLARAQVQSRVARAAPQRWAPILESGSAASSAFYVTQRYARSLKNLIVGKVRTDPQGLYAIVRAIVEGLADLQRVCGRAHGGLTPGNVLIDGDVLDRARIVLTDPADDWLVAEDGLANDLRALGELIYQLVYHRPFRDLTHTPVEATSEWNALHSRRRGWRKFCRRLLGSIDEDPLNSLEEVAEALDRLKPPVSRRAKLLAATVMGVVISGALFISYRYHRYRADVAVYRTDYQQWIAPLQRWTPQVRASYGGNPGFAALLAILDSDQASAQQLDPSTWSFDSMSKLSAARQVDVQLRMALSNWRTAENAAAVQLRNIGYGNSSSAIQQAADALEPDTNLSQHMSALLQTDRAMVRVNALLPDIDNPRIPELQQDPLPARFIQNARDSVDRPAALGVLQLDSLASQLQSLKNSRNQLVSFFKNDWPLVDVDYFEQHVVPGLQTADPVTDDELNAWESAAMSQARRLLPRDDHRKAWSEAQSARLDDITRRYGDKIPRGGEAESFFHESQSRIQDDVNRYLFLDWKLENLAQINDSHQNAADELTDLEAFAQNPDKARPSVFLMKLRRELVLPGASPAVTEDSHDPINLKWRTFCRLMAADVRNSPEALRDDSRFQTVQAVNDKVAAQMRTLSVMFDYDPAQPFISDLFKKYRAKAIEAILPNTQISSDGITVKAAVLKQWAESWQQIHSTALAVTRDANTLQTLLDQGYRLGEKSPQLISIDSLAARLASLGPQSMDIAPADFVLYQQVRLQPLLDRVGHLRDVESMSDPVLMLQEAMPLDAAPEVKMSVWYRLATPANVPLLTRDNFYDLGRLGEQLIHLVQRQDVAALVMQRHRNLWLSLVLAAKGPDDPMITLARDIAGPLGLGALGPTTILGIEPDLEKNDGLSPLALFNLLTNVAYQDVRFDDDNASDADVRKVVDYLCAEISAAKSLKGIADEFVRLQQLSAAGAQNSNAVKDGPAGWRLSDAGPWVEKTGGNLDTITFVFNKTHSLTFRRLPGTEGSTYLSTTAVPLDLFVDVVNAGLSGRNPALAADLRNSIFLTGTRKSQGPYGWEPQGNLIAGRIGNPDQYWIGDFPSLMDALKAAMPNISQMIAECPDPKCPVQFVSPMAAAYFAGLLGCRLPTLAEWQAAAKMNFDSIDPRQDPISIHLPCEPWLSASHFFDQMNVDEVRSAFYSPDALAGDDPNAKHDIWSEEKMRGIAMMRAARVTLDKDHLWFRPVDAGGGLFPNIIGNTACYVLQNAPKSLESWQNKSCDDLLTLLTLQKCAVIGGSAFTPPEIPPDVPVDATDQVMLRNVGYCDVGIRLAYTPASLPLAVRLRDAVRHAQERFAQLTASAAR